MPELKLYRLHPERTPVRMICMYCGQPADHKQEWRVANRKATPGGGGTDITPVPAGDDPVSAVFGLLTLPFVIWDLFKTLLSAFAAVFGYFTQARPEANPVPEPKPLDPPDTLVTVTTCGLHRHFRNRFGWAGLGLLVGLAVLWFFAIKIVRRDMGTDNIELAVNLMLAAIGCTALLPLALSTWYVFGGPVIVDRVTEDEVVLDRIRAAYFEAAGISPNREGE